MPGIWIYSEDAATAGQLVTAGLILKEAMKEPVGVIALDSGEQDTFIAAGADKVVILKNKNNWPEGYAEPIADLVAREGATVILVGATARGKDVAAKVAARLETGLVTEAQSIRFADGRLETTRLLYGGLAVTVEQSSLPAIATVPPGTFDSPPSGAGEGDASSAVVEVETRIVVSGVSPIERQGADIAAAARIVCVGRGLGQKDDLALVEELAAALGAEVACTRGIAEDYHWLPVERYVGISGQKVRPELYLSLGVSGQVQHVAGIRDSGIIVAVDTNEKAPIFEAADYGIVGDLYEVAPLLVKALKNNSGTIG